MEDLAEFIMAYGFPAIFGVLLLSGIGVPIPEDIPLLAAGALARAKQRFWFDPALLCIAFVLARDSLAWAGGRFLGPQLMKSRMLRSRLTPERMQTLQSFFRKHGIKAVAFGRFMAGVRSLVFFVAGFNRISYARFIGADGTAAVLSVPLFVALGWTFFGRRNEIHALITRFQGGAAALTVVGVGIWLWRRRAKMRRAASAPVSPA